MSSIVGGPSCAGAKSRSVSVDEEAVLRAERRVACAPIVGFSTSSSRFVSNPVRRCKVPENRARIKESARSCTEVDAPSVPGGTFRRSAHG